MMAAAAEGIRTGELIPVEASQLMYATLGPNVFYFLSAPLMRLISEIEVFHPSALEFRRKAIVDYLGQSMFMDREHGGRIAARVLADTPMPQYIEPPAHQLQSVETQIRKIAPGRFAGC
jgi:TetR/AcrR family transcriptional regulator